MNLAIFPSQGLGDGIIQLVLAQNLAKLGINIDYFQGYLADINPLIKNINVYKPTDAILDKKINKYDILLIDRGSKAVNLTTYLERIKSKFAIYSMSRMKQRRSRTSISDWGNPDFIPPTLIVDEKKIDFTYFNGKSLRANRISNLSTAAAITHFLTRHNLIQIPDIKPDLEIPANWQRHKYSNRVLIHPSSNSAKKNWLPQRFLRLATVLKRKGYYPVICVSPKEMPFWKNQMNEEFELPQFDTILALTHFYYESGLHIGTDSGNGHLASALGLPTITIVNRYQSPFAWRPNWGENIIVMPLISKNLVGRHYWKFTISENRVLESVGKLLPR